MSSNRRCLWLFAARCKNLLINPDNPGTVGCWMQEDHTWTAGFLYSHTVTVSSLTCIYSCVQLLAFTNLLEHITDFIRVISWFLARSRMEGLKTWSRFFYIINIERHSARIFHDLYSQSFQPN